MLLIVIAAMSLFLFFRRRQVVLGSLSAAFIRTASTRAKRRVPHGASVPSTGRTVTSAGHVASTNAYRSTWTKTVQHITSSSSSSTLSHSQSRSSSLPAPLV